MVYKDKLKIINQSVETVVILLLYGFQNIVTGVTALNQTRLNVKISFNNDLNFKY